MRCWWSGAMAAPAIWKPTTPSRPDFQVPNVGLRDGDAVLRLHDRRGLRQQLDRVERALDRPGPRPFDAFQEQAWRMVTGAAARRAFDLNLEEVRVRDRYGRN